MDINIQETYSEVYSILNMLGENYIKMLPNSVYKMIKEAKSPTYIPKYTTEISLNNQHIKKESLSMIALFHLNYWCNSSQEKLQLKQILKDNEEKYQIELRQKYNPDNLFKNRQKVMENSSVEKISIIEYKKKSFLKNIFDKIKHLFRKS